MTEKRVLIVFMAFISFAFLIQLSMIDINVNGRYVANAQRQQFKNIYVDDGRAVITDNNFKNITNTTPQLKALVSVYNSDLQAVFNVLEEKEKYNFYDNLKVNKNFVANINESVENEMIFQSSTRYSDFNIAQHLIGYTNAEGDGVSGIEKAFNSVLKDAGETTAVNMEINAYGEIISLSESVETKQKDNPPKMLALTIDNSIQRICEGIAKEYIPNGAIVVMESKTGKIKAMVSTPFYNANNINESLNQDNSPLLNKAMQAYEPGSVIKPLWAAVLMQNGYNSEGIYQCIGEIDVNGHIYHCANNMPHGPVDMERALVVSCNCYFVNAYIKDKSFKFAQMAQSINFGTGLEIARDYSTTDGVFPTFEELLNLGQLSSISFGQGKILLTPIHVAAYMNIFANNGKYISPQIAQGVYNAQTKELITNLYTMQEKQVIDSKVSQKIKNMLKMVVEEGARQNAKPQFLAAAGKTGTAQTGKINENGSEIFTAWFAGFYPFDSPQYTVCIAMYNGGESTRTAAPVFKKICDSLFYLI